MCPLAPQGILMLKLLFAKTNDTLDVGGDSKRYIFALKTGVVTTKGIF
jgi:hypothetical protein